MSFTHTTQLTFKTQKRLNAGIESLTEKDVGLRPGLINFGVLVAILNGSVFQSDRGKLEANEGKTSGCSSQGNA